MSVRAFGELRDSSAPWSEPSPPAVEEAGEASKSGPGHPSRLVIGLTAGLVILLVVVAVLLFR